MRNYWTTMLIASFIFGQAFVSYVSNQSLIQIARTLERLVR